MYEESASASPAPPVATCVGVARDEFVVVGYSDGALAMYVGALAFDPRAPFDARARDESWISPAPRGSWVTDAEGNPRRGCDAAAASVPLSRVIRCCGTPPAIDVLDVNTGTLTKRLKLPTAWPCVGACAVSSCGFVADAYVYVVSASKWNHSGDEFLGNAATCAVWRANDDANDISACAVIVVNAERPRAGTSGEEKTLAPFAGVRTVDDGIEYVTVTVNFSEKMVRGEHRRHSFKNGERGVGVKGRTFDMGWMPKHRAARSRAFDEDERSMPSVPLCAITSQFIVTVWCDGEHTVSVVDRKSEQSNDSRRFLFDALRYNIEKCVARPSASVTRVVVDLQPYDDDAYIALIVRDMPVLKHGQTARASDVDYRFILVPTGFKNRIAHQSQEAAALKPLVDLANIDKTPSSCAICLDDLSFDACVSVPCCRASFCEGCLTSYMSLNINKGCPMCRDVTAFWRTNSAVLPAADASIVASFEVANSGPLRSQLQAYRALEQDVTIGEYVALDEHHNRGDRAPLTLANSGYACTVNGKAVEIRALIASDRARATAVLSNV